MADEDDLITIVDVTDPDDPSYSDMKTRRRYLTEQELSNLKPMLEKVGAYKFFAAEFNFADGPAVKQFIESVELEEFKRCKQRKIVQETMKGVVAGREVVIDSDLIEKAFGLVDDGENIIKPKGETDGLHNFYIKPKYIHLCQNYRGVYLKLFKSEYNYFVNMTHQIQTYCCGGTAESQITLTQYRAIDLMVRGKPVNWNRYLLQNIQDKLRKYKTGPCALYFGGMLTALIYKALHVDYNLVNKPLLIPPETPERRTLPEGDKAGKSSGKKKEKERESAQKLIKAPPPPPPKKREAMRRETGAVTRAQRILTPPPEILELEPPPTKKKSAAAVKASQDKKRKRVKERVETAVAKKQKPTSGKSKQQKWAAEPEAESEPSAMQNDETEDDMPSPVTKSPATAPPAYKSLKTSETPRTQTPATAPPPDVSTPYTTPYTEGGIRKTVEDVGKLGGEIVLATATNRLSRLFAYANGTAGSDDTLALSESKDLWSKYDHLFSLQHEQQLEHIVSKKMLEQSLQKVQELEDALERKDKELSQLKRELANVKSSSNPGMEDDGSDRSQEQQAPLKIRLKVGQKKVSAAVPAEDLSNGNGEVPMETDPVAAGDQTEKSPEKVDAHEQLPKIQAGEEQVTKRPDEELVQKTTRAAEDQLRKIMEESEEVEKAQKITEKAVGEDGQQEKTGRCEGQEMNTTAETDRNTSNKAEADGKDDPSEAAAVEASSK